MEQPNEPLTHCYNCQDPIQDLRDLEHMGFLPLAGKDYSMMICAKCTIALGLRTVEELRAMGPRNR